MAWLDFTCDSLGRVLLAIPPHSFRIPLTFLDASSKKKTDESASVLCGLLYMCHSNWFPVSLGHHGNVSSEWRSWRDIFGFGSLYRCWREKASFNPLPALTFPEWPFIQNVKSCVEADASGWGRLCQQPLPFHVGFFFFTLKGWVHNITNPVLIYWLILSIFLPA